MNAIEIRDLKVVMGGMPILHGVSVTVPPKSIVSILGANGAGKTTLLRAASGIYPVASGTVSLNAENITGLPSHEIVSRGLSHAPEGRHLFPNMTVLENLRVGSLPRPKGEFAAALDEMVQYFPVIKAKLDQRAGALSGGEQQMVCLARGLMSRPNVFLLDEPSLGLAPLVVAQILELIIRIRDAGTAVLLVEQNARAALKISQYAYVMEGGRIGIEDEAAKLLHDTRVEQAYLGG
jgi:branched-chain amino acid transport system ATP-binding protein